MDKILLESGKYKISITPNNSSLDFYNWLKRFDGNPSYYDDLEKIKDDIPLKQEPEIPRFLSHCSYPQHIKWIMQDRKMGGRRVLSGNVEFIPSVIHFSAIPFLTGNYYVGLVFNTNKLIKRNPEKKLYPSFYFYQSPMKEEREQYLLYFDEMGWNKKVRDIGDRQSRGFPCEREWNMETLIHFDLSDIEAIISRLDNWKPYEFLNYFLIDFLENPKDFLKQYNRLKNSFYKSSYVIEYEPYHFKLKNAIDDKEEIIAIVMDKRNKMNEAFTKSRLENSYIYKGIIDNDYSIAKQFLQNGTIITENHIEMW